MNLKRLSKLIAVSSVTMILAGLTSTGVSAAAASPKPGAPCTKEQYGKVVKAGQASVQCTFNSKSKKYIWRAVATTATTAPTIDLARLDKKGWPSKLVIGGVPAENVATMQTKWQGLVDMLKAELGIPVEFYAATSYAGVIEASIAGKIDVVAWGAMSYIVAKLNGAKIEPVGISKYLDNTTSYTSKLYVKSGSPISGIKDLKGKKVCFVSATSTSGNLIPTEGVLNAGLTTKDMTVDYKGTHSNSIIGLSKDQCEAAFACCLTFGEGDLAALKPADYKMVWESGPIPNGPFSIRTTLPASLKAAVRNAILTKANKEHFVSKGYNGCTVVATCVIVEDKNVGSIVEVKDSFYDYIRAVCEATKSSSCKA